MAMHFAAPGDVAAIDPHMGHRRTGEYALFRSPEFVRWLGMQGLELGGMRDLRSGFRARLSQGRSE